MSFLFPVARRVSLRALLVIPFALQLLGIVGLAGYVFDRNGQRAISQLADRLMVKFGDRVEEQLDDRIAIAKKLNEMNARAIASGLFDSNNRTRLEKYLWNQQQTFSVRALSYRNPNNEFTSIRSIAGKSVIIERLLPDLDRIEAYAIDNRGNRAPLRGSLRDRAIAIDPSFDVRSQSENAFTSSLTRKTHWQVIPSARPAASKTAIALYSPIFDSDRDGRIGRERAPIGEIGVEIDLDLARISNSIGVERGQIWLVDRSSLVVARASPRSTPEEQLSPAAQNRAFQVLLKSLKEREISLSAVQAPQQYRLTLQGQSQFLRFVPYQDKYGLDWIIVLVVPESELAGQLDFSRRNTILVCLVALAVALATGLLATRRISAPFARLTQAAKAMAKGDLKKTFPSSRVRELDDLAESLDEMARHVQKSLAALRESEAELEQFLQALPIGAIAIDCLEQPHYVNPRAVEILGIDIALKSEPEQFSQIYQIYKVGTAEKYPWEELPLAVALRGQFHHIDDAEIHRGDEIVYLEAWGTPIYDTHGQIIYALIAFQDITQRKQAETLLAEYNKVLEEQVERRTQQLAANNLELEVEISERQEALRELRRAEQVARESEAKFSGIVRIAEDAIISVDEQQRIQLFNRGAEKIFGYAGEEVLGQPLDILLPPEMRAIHRQHIRNFGIGLERAYQGMGKSARNSIRGRRKNGEEFLAEASISKLHLRNGTIYTAILNDISERQRIETALRQSERRFRSAFETAAIGVSLISPEGRFLQVNASLCEMLGYSETELLAMNFQDITYLEDIEVDLQYIQRTLSGEIRFFDTEKRYWHKNGTLIWTRETAALVRDENNLPLYLIAQIQDVSDRKAAEVALQEKEEYLRLVLDNIPQQVFWKDTHLVFQGCNANWAMAAGLENSSEIVGKTDYDLLPNPELAKTFRDRDREVIERGEPELHVLAKKIRSGQDGEAVWLDMNKIPIRNARGEVIGILGVLEDITLRKQAEEALRLEQQKTDRLLRNILPEAIAEQLKQSPNAIAEQFDNVSILFADIVGFTPLAASMSPTALVELLNQIFSRFDALAEERGLEKIKTIGDAYLAVGGLPLPKPDSAEAVAEMALGMIEAIANFRNARGEALSLRVGINTGSVVAGVIGQKKFIYDLWGDAVNIASRMESSGLPGRIQVTAPTYERLREGYEFEERGIVSVKGRGEMMTYWLVGPKGTNSLRNNE
ncbi:MAG: PAS domain S-box protein [Cyanobacteriota bacterium]|nr:PAS domain S-box protein [Cyanobacteriota bacterium]